MCGSKQCEHITKFYKVLEMKIKAMKQPTQLSSNKSVYHYVKQ